MDRTWILKDDRLSKEYSNGIDSFVGVARNYLNENNECRCPCRSCVNRSFVSISTIRAHLMRHGFTISYDVWVSHGEKESIPSTFLAGSSSRAVLNEPITVQEDMEQDDDVLRPLYEDLARGVENDSSTEQPSMSTQRLFGDSEEKLYPWCKYLMLEVVVRLMHIKVLNRWSDKSFDMLLNFINLMWPDLNNFPCSTYNARKRLRDIGLGYEKIDACKNDCSLFWKDRANADNCHVCKESRYKVNDGKGKKVPYKSLRYFPVTPRLKRLFLSRHTAKEMRWHKDKRDDSSDLLRHLADGVAWKHFNETYPQFSDDARNVRLGLATDGFSPFTTSYSMWPVILVPYNLPLWKCMQQPFRMMSLLIPGPNSPGKDIDVYLQPLVDELKDLWNVGVETFDAACNKKFLMRAALLWTINDFPAYGNLSGWSTHGKKACPVCLEDTASQSITSKICFMGHRRLLPPTHPWRRSKLHDGKFELRPSPKIKTGDEILQVLEKLPVITFGKHSTNKDFKRKRTPAEHNWTKKSVFFELPYWSKLKIRHILDVMHIEKNICDNVLYTLLNTEGRSKDTMKSRMDLENLNIRKDLHLKKLASGKVVKPAADYVLKSADRTKFLEFLTSVKYPDGYAANILRGVNVREGKVYGLKSHDSHVIFQRLLPIAIRPFLPKDLCTALIEYSVFFQQLTSKSLCKSDLDKLQESIVMTLCKLERIYPPSFFDVMVHLAVHLVGEAQLAGPVSFRWMFPIERDMGTCKSYIRNRAYPEGSIAEAYSINEALTFCSMYFHEEETRFTRPERNDDDIEINSTLSVFCQKAKTYGGVSIEYWSKADIEKIHWAVLNNCDELSDFKNEHMTELEWESPDQLFERHHKRFPSWFAERVQYLRSEGSPRATDEIHALSHEPARKVHCHPGCIVNGVRFRIKERDERKKTQNSGVSVLGENDEDYYGYLTKVVELEYLMDYKVVMFVCDWYDTEPRKKRLKRDYHLTSVNTAHRWFVNEPYILAIQGKQVFYIDDPKLGRDWKVVQKVEQRQIWDVSKIEETHDTSETLPVSEAYQQNQSTRIEWAVDADIDHELTNDDLHMGGTKLENITEHGLERLHRSPQETNEYVDTELDNDVNDLDEYDIDSESDY